MSYYNEDYDFRNETEDREWCTSDLESTRVNIETAVTNTFTEETDVCRLASTPAMQGMQGMHESRSLGHQDQRTACSLAYLQSKQPSSGPEPAHLQYDNVAQQYQNEGLSPFGWASGQGQRLSREIYIKETGAQFNDNFNGNAPTNTGRVLLHHSSIDDIRHFASSLEIQAAPSYTPTQTNTHDPYPSHSWTYEQVAQPNPLYDIVLSGTRTEHMSAEYAEGRSQALVGGPRMNSTACDSHHIVHPAQQSIEYTGIDRCQFCDQFLDITSNSHQMQDCHNCKEN